jgi:hypothetical protein
MLFAVSGLTGSAVVATDDRVGTVKDFLFDDRTWRIRWMVIDCGAWLPGRKVLIHPSSLAPLDLPPPAAERLPMMGTPPDLAVSVRLTRQQIESSPDISEDAPVSAAMEHSLHEHYGWVPDWGSPYYGMNTIAEELSPDYAATGAPDPGTPGHGDPHLRSAAEVHGYHIHATDGDIGHIDTLLADDGRWDIRYLIVATRNWWPGRHVLLAPFAVRDVDWLERKLSLNVTREQVKSSPPWDPAAVVDRLTEERLHRHYGWPGYGW